MEAEKYISFVNQLKIKIYEKSEQYKKRIDQINVGDILNGESVLSEFIPHYKEHNQ